MSFIKKKSTLFFTLLALSTGSILTINSKLQNFIQLNIFKLLNSHELFQSAYYSQSTDPNLLAIITNLTNKEMAQHSLPNIDKDSQCTLQTSSALLKNAKDYGAHGDGVTNDTFAIQATIDQIAGTGGTAYLPVGVYMINADTHILLKSNMTFFMEKGAILKAIPNNKESYGILKVEHAANINIIGGLLQGERYQHQGNTGEWGMGLEISASNNIVVKNVTATDNWGDGFYVGNGATQIRFCSVTADNNRRQGLSVTSADGITINNSVFMNTNGALPMDGIDLEPNNGETVRNVQILNSQFLNNKGSGIESVVADDLVDKAFVKQVIIDHNTVYNNGAIGAYSAGIKISRQSSQLIMNNIVKENLQDGIAIVNNATNNILSGNQISGNGNKIDANIGFGILFYGNAIDNIVTNNQVFGNTNLNIKDHSNKNYITNNKHN